jgi:uncharacterized protein YraI
VRPHIAQPDSPEQSVTYGVGSRVTVRGCLKPSFGVNDDSAEYEWWSASEPMSIEAESNP